MTTINNHRHQQNFKGWVRVNKTNLANLGKNIEDSTSAGLRTTGLGTSVIGEATVFPADLASNKGLAGTIENNKNIIVQKIKNIFGRKSNPMKITDPNPERTKELVQSTAGAASGSSMVSTGLGSYTSAGASAMDQSVHYPVLGSEYLPKDLIKSFEENPLQNAAYDILYDKRGMGNESASLFSTFTSGGGISSQVLGSNALGKVFSKEAKEISKNIPS